MALDPASALGVAGNVIEFVEFVGKIVSGVYEIYKSEDEALGEHTNLLETAAQLQHTNASLDKSLHLNSLGKPLTENERQLQALGQSCQQVSSDLSVAIRNLKVQSKSKSWRSFRQALNSVWSQEKIDVLARRLDEVRKQVVVCVLVSLREQADAAYNQQSNVISRIDQANEDFKNVGQEFLAQMNNAQRWGSELIEAIHEQRWQASTSFPYEGALQWDKSNRMKALSDRFLMRLRFSNINDRHERISLAHEKTFEWIFKSSEGVSSWSDFPNWLSSSAPLYWITGKPGSGKSTLMKFVHNDPRTYEFLQTWVTDSKLLKASYFFWNSGTSLQMSQEGMLRSLLFNILDQCQSLIAHVFPERWQVFDIFGDDPALWTWTELLRAFKLLLSESSAFGKVFLLIDGLDEFDGDHTDLVELIKTAASYENVKICVSSRPWNVFQEAFDKRPSLLVQELTYRDIKIYITTKFLAHSGFKILQRQDPVFADDLLESIAKKAEGVFLWVVFVVKSLLVGITNGDRISDLEKRLQALPAELEYLFEKILDSLDKFYFEHASELFQLVRVALEPPSLLCLSFADEDNPDFCLKQPISRLKKVDYSERASSMLRRINSRCKGLLEVAPLSHSYPDYQKGNGSSDLISVAPDPENERRTFHPDQNVQYLHRTVRDFLEHPRIWSRITSATLQTFNPDVSLCRSFASQLKIIEPKSLDSANLWNTILWCIEYAKRFQESQPKTSFDILVEVDRVAGFLSNIRGPDGVSMLERRGIIKQDSQSHWTSTRMAWVQNCTFRHLAAVCGLHEYLAMQFELDERALLSPQSTPLLASAICDYDIFSGTENRSLGQQFVPSIKTVKVLLEHGADPNQSFEGLTVFQKASSQSTMERTRNQGPNLDICKAVWLEVLTLLKEYGAKDFDPTFRQVLRTKGKNQTHKTPRSMSGSASETQSTLSQYLSGVNEIEKGRFRTLFRRLIKNKAKTPLAGMGSSKDKAETSLDGMVWRERTKIFPGGAIYLGNIGYELVKKRALMDE